MTTETTRIVKIRAKAFTGMGVQLIECVVDLDGSVRVYDDIAKHFTRCHSLCKSAQAKIRKIAQGKITGGYR